VEAAINSCQRSPHVRLIRDAPAQEFRPRGKPSGKAVRMDAGLERVQDSHLHSLFEQTINQVRTNKPRSACNERKHFPSFTPSLCPWFRFVVRHWRDSYLFNPKVNPAS
jgi:hypothetical protein